jgi:hypothetical protein
MQLHKSLGSLGSGGSKSAATGSEAIMACYGNILPSLAKLPLLKGPAGPYISMRNQGVVDYPRTEDTTIQAISPFILSTPLAPGLVSS